MLRRIGFAGFAVFVAVCSALETCPDVKKADIVVAVDESGSVTQDGWDDQANFLAKVISKLPIGPEEVQVGLLQFSTKSVKKFDLNKYKTQKELMQAMKDLKYTQKGLTYTHDALDMAGKMLATEFGARKKTQKVVIVLTDGASNKPNETLKAAKALQGMKVKVLVVGVGNTRESELKAMASEPKFVLHTKNTASLLKDDFIKEKVIDSLKCITKCAKVQKADVVFMIDQSQSIQREGFQKEKEFIRIMVDGLKINKDRVRVGLIAFADDARDIIHLTPVKTSQEIKESVKNLNWQWGRTQTHKGLIMATNYFSKSGGMRKGVPHVLVVLTDGKSTKTDLTIAEAKKFRKAGHLVVAIGVGDQVDKAELENLASEKRYIIRAKTFKDLADFKFITNEVMESVDCVVMPA